MKECPSSPTGRHDFSQDMEYDSTGMTWNCEHCGAPQEDPEACEASPEGKHSWLQDLEEDTSGKTFCCEHCFEKKQDET